MLGDLAKVEDMLFKAQELQSFLQKHPLMSIIKLMNKSTKKQTINRIENLFRHISRSPSWKQLLQLCRVEGQENQNEFKKYIMSDKSQAFYDTMLSHLDGVINLIEHEEALGEGLMQMIGGIFGLRMVKVLNKVYKLYGDHKCLYSQSIYEGLEKGLKNQDTEVMMRYAEVVANIAITSEGFKFIQGSGQGMLNQIINTYQTEDILLKLNIVEIVSVLGLGIQSSKIVFNHKVWKTIQKQSMDKQQQFYVRKCLLKLLINVSNQGHIQLGHKYKIEIASFIEECFQKKGQYAEGALEIIVHLFNSYQGCKIVVGSHKLFMKFCLYSKATEEKFKHGFLDCLISLTGQQILPNNIIIINILNCIGNPNLCGSLSHNINANNSMVQGLNEFCKWFTEILNLPFEDYQVKLLHTFQNLLQFYDVCVRLFQDDKVTKYLLKKVSNIENKVLKNQKETLIRKIILRGQDEWKGLELAAYSKMLQKEIKGSVIEVSYALDTQQ